MEDPNDRLTLTNTETLDHPYSLCGRRCYVIGFQNGLFPDIGWHKTKEMGGLWMHPIKVADGMWLSVDSEDWPPPKSYNPIRREWFKECDKFVLGDGGAWSEHIYHKAAWEVLRRQFVPQEEAALGVEIRVKSTNNEPSRVRLTVLVRFDILSAWQSGWSDPIHLETEASDGGVNVHGVSGYDIPYEYGFWTAAMRSDPKPDRLAVGESLWGPERTQSNSGTSVLMTFLLDVDPEAKVRFVIAGDIEGEEGAVDSATRVLTGFDRLAQEKIAWHRHIANELTGVETPEPMLDDAFLWGKLNVEWMTQYSPCLGTCVVAGHQDFTSYFGCDTFLSIRGILAAGLLETAKESLRVIGAQAAKNGGKVPHEFSTTGYVHDPGSVGETPLFVRSVWDTYLWSGDEEFLEELYPVCRRGVWEYIPSEPVKDGVHLSSGRNCNMPLQTGCAVVSEFNYGRIEQGLRFLRMMARTMGHASPGAFPEALDPDGDLEKFRHFRSAHWNYLQLWSAATYLEGMIWGLLHVEPDAARGTVTMTPRLSKDWPHAEVKNLVIGQSRINVRLDETGANVTHVDGSELKITIKEPEG